MSITSIIGGHGFVGREICKILESIGGSYNVIGRGDVISRGEKFDRIIYCAGEGDCQNKPFDVFDANCSLLYHVLKNTNFNKLVYISSTRLYMNGDSSDESSSLHVEDSDNRRLFNLTKMASEELCLRSKKNITILRPSNIYGTALKSTLFLPSIIKDAITRGVVNMFVDKSYAKDYVSVKNVAEACVNFSSRDIEYNKIINVASGKNVTASDLAKLLIKETNCKVIWHETPNRKEEFPVIKNELLRKYMPEMKIDDVMRDMESMISQFRMCMGDVKK
ncbi:NAD(P)-dependent oxidoreductase [Enterobacteriaceae bacterium BIT-l23]|uniref:NAD-dependent epimerase/dehydratase family protein n=1 Tax=Jejubacter sp. L23 TaxID=3092086 RepID=UPI001585C637|nr:NAD(P)-dependent oxidoreductase [Enterobacteriaceae bacterium BIT-l23]